MKYSCKCQTCVSEMEMKLDCRLVLLLFILGLGLFQQS